MSATMDDFLRLRVRDEAKADHGLGVRADDPPSFLGQVASVGSKIGVGKFLIVNPVAVLGPDVEGGVGTFSVDAATAVPVYLLGPTAPARGDYLICRFVQHRWVTDRPGAAPAANPVIGIAGCTCQGTPASLSLTAIYGQDEDAHTYGNSYQSGPLAYYTSAPPYMPQAAFPGAAYYSPATWTDDYGALDYFRITCYSTQYTLAIGQFNGTNWQSPSPIYTWQIGGRPGQVNTCNPFLLGFGRVQQGIYFNGRFVVSG